MPPEISSSVPARLARCLVNAVGPALRTSRWLVKVTVLVSLLVLVLKLAGLLELLARVFDPLFALVGLPGEASLVFVTACLLNIYAAIAVIQTLGLSGQVLTILALMCLISHSLPVECAVQKKTGSRVVGILLVRLGAAFVGALALNLLLPATSHAAAAASLAPPAAIDYLAEFKIWLLGITYLCLKMIVLVSLLMVLQQILDEFGVIRLLSRLLRWPLAAMGLPHETAFLWVVANSIGLAYGSGVMIEHVQAGRLSPRHADLLNYHIAVSHSLLEDTLLFVAIGVSVWWIILPRLILATLVVWGKRLIERWAARHAPLLAPTG